MRGIKLEDMAAATKIGTRSLRAVEEEDFDKLPGGIFNKGFVRAYARYIGIDEDQAVSEYLTAAGENSVAESFGAEHLKKLESNWKRPKEQFSRRVGKRAAAALLLLAVVALVVVASVGTLRHSALERYHQWQARRHAAAEVQAAAKPAPASAEPEPAPPDNGPAPASAGNAASPSAATETPSAPPAASQNAAPVSPSAREEPSKEQPPPGMAAAIEKQATEAPPNVAGTFAVKVEARETCWILVTVDGKPPVERTLPAAQHMSFHAKEKLTLRLGNAAAVDLYYNGQLVPSLAEGPNVREVTFGPTGLVQ
jgi:cytoskeleton protein RodZ